MATVDKSSVPRIATAKANYAFLMCPPHYYDASFVLNPWMSLSDTVDSEAAFRQWRLLERTLRSLGADVRRIEPSPSSPAMVFTADGALVYAEKRALILRNDGWRSFVEAKLLAEWFRAEGFETEPLPPRYRVDGGNILRLAPDLYLIGLKPGSNGRAERYVAKLLWLATRARVCPIALVDQRFLHLDMVLGNLGGRALLVFWQGLHPLSQAHLKRWLDLPMISVDEDDARRFACNCLTIGDTVITGPISDNLKKQIVKHGFRVRRLNLSEFYKAGGGAKCLTLPLT